MSANFRVIHHSALVTGLALYSSLVGGCAGVGNFFPFSASPNLSEVAREIEEADIVKLQGDFLYVANPYTGLRIIDVSAVDEPQLMGRVALGGRAVELFVRDDRVFILTAADFLNCAGQPIGFNQTLLDPALAPDYDGSRLWVIDVSDANEPAVTTTLDLDGFVKATRRVGDVIYAAGNTVLASEEDMGDGGAEGNEEVELFTRAAFVSSINIADPQNVTLVETETFAGRSLNIHVDEEFMLVFGSDSALFDTSVITYVDISDPAGDVLPRDQIRVPGTILDRFSVDAHDNAMRVITEQFIQSVFSEVVALYVYDLTNPDEIVRLARLPVAVDRGLAAARFDGPRAYVDTTRFDSPLLVLDLADPASPQIAGEITSPGVGTQLTPLDDRLIAVGFDTSAGIRPAISLYDVNVPSNPMLLDRIVVGEEFTFDTRSTATVDEKALRVLDEAGLILLPYSTFDNETGLFTDSVQFISFGDTSLAERGVIEHAGFVRRADELAGRIWILSDQAFQTVNVDDLDVPSSLASLPFVNEQELLDSGLYGCAENARNLATRISSTATPSLCGVLGAFSMFAVPLGYVTLRFSRHRRY